MQPVPHPDSWFIGWLGEQKLLDPALLRTYQQKRDAAALQEDPPTLGALLEGDAAALQKGPPSLGALLERDGLLTPEQRRAGELEAARRCAEFMSWRAQALRDRDRRHPPG